MLGRLALGALALSLSLLGCASPADSDDDGVEATAEALTEEPGYEPTRLHSKLSADIVAGLKVVAARSGGDRHRFIKVGDSITYSTSFLDCLDRATVADAQLEETRAWFDTGSWQRRSKASTVGWHTNQPLAGSPAPLDTEIAEMQPVIAVVMLGTNDNYVGTDRTYRRNLSKLVDRLLERDVIPILSTIPQRAQSGPNANIPRMNAIVRSVAAGERIDAAGRLVARASTRIPLMDFYLALEDVPRHGLAGDGVHPNVSSRGACDFGADGMTHGYNVRTRLALEAIDRVKRVVLDGTSDPE
ncbi:MAG: SGNH/GDSL hydrolase family protein [Polyangiaceae bacterium]